jgi:glycerol-3-phosphate acyltransferase PlsY
MIFELLSAFAAGYFVGGVPVAAIAARLAGRDIFAVGSGNMGAMNAARNLGWGLGVAVFVLDVAKGGAAALLGGGMAQAAGLDATLPTALAAGVGAVAGHAWSPFVRFRGGKALATGFGATLPVVPLAGLAGLVLMVGLILLLRRATLGAMLALALYPFLTGAVLLRAGRPTEDAFAAVTAAALVAAISLVKHVAALRQPGV